MDKLFGLACYLVLGYVIGLHMWPDYFSATIPMTHWENIWTYFYLGFWPLVVLWGLLGTLFSLLLVFVAIVLIAVVIGKSFANRRRENAYWRGQQ